VQCNIRPELRSKEAESRGKRRYRKKLRRSEGEKVRLRNGDGRDETEKGGIGEGGNGVKRLKRGAGETEMGGMKRI